MGKISANLKKLLGSLSRDHRFAVVVRRGASQLGGNGLDAHAFSTERARLAGGNFASHGLSAHGLSTGRARLAGGTSLRLWFQKKCLLPMGILIFFSKIPPILKLEGGFFSTLKSF